jgi:hypothetical protein
MNSRFFITIFALSSFSIVAMKPFETLQQKHPESKLAQALPLILEAVKDVNMLNKDAALTEILKSLLSHPGNDADKLAALDFIGVHQFPCGPLEDVANSVKMTLGILKTGISDKKRLSEYFVSLIKIMFGFKLSQTKWTSREYITYGLMRQVLEAFNNQYEDVLADAKEKNPEIMGAL